jgi:hypothetical protein
MMGLGWMKASYTTAGTRTRDLYVFSSSLPSETVSQSENCRGYKGG